MEFVILRIQRKFTILEKGHGILLQDIWDVQILHMVVLFVYGSLLVAFLYVKVKILLLSVWLYEKVTVGYVIAHLLKATLWTMTDHPWGCAMLLTSA